MIVWIESSYLHELKNIAAVPEKITDGMPTDDSLSFISYQNIAKQPVTCNLKPVNLHPVNL
jgi:hypothetical protein